MLKDEQPKLFILFVCIFHVHLFEICLKLVKKISRINNQERCLMDGLALVAKK